MIYTATRILRYVSPIARLQLMDVASMASIRGGATLDIDGPTLRFVLPLDPTVRNSAAAAFKELLELPQLWELSELFSVSICLCLRASVSLSLCLCLCPNSTFRYGARCSQTPPHPPAGFAPGQEPGDTAWRDGCRVPQAGPVGVLRTAYPQPARVPLSRPAKDQLRVQRPQVSVRLPVPL